MLESENSLSPELLAGRTAVIAGGTGSVGRQVVMTFLDAGATVVVPSRSAEKIDALRNTVGPAREGRLLTLEGDLGDEADGVRVRDAVVERAGRPDAVVASLGAFVPAPSVTDAPLSHLERVLDGYLLAHFLVAKALLPVLNDEHGSYTFINGPLAFDPLFPGSGLVSIATAAQAMLARVVIKETGEGGPRVNELVLYTSFGWGEDEKRGPSPVSQGDVARYAAYLASDRGAAVRGQTIHLDSLEPLDALLVSG